MQRTVVFVSCKTVHINVLLTYHSQRFWYKYIRYRYQHLVRTLRHFKAQNTFGRYLIIPFIVDPYLVFTVHGDCKFLIRCNPITHNGTENPAAINHGHKAYKKGYFLKVKHVHLVTAWKSNNRWFIYLARNKENRQRKDREKHEMVT